MDVEGIRRDRGQLWAEALVRYRRGDAWHVDTVQLRALAEREQGDRVAQDDWEAIVERWLARPDHEVGEGIDRHREPFALSEHGPTTHEILIHAIRKPPGQITRGDSMRAAEVLRAIGCDAAVARREEGALVRRYFRARRNNLSQPYLRVVETHDAA